MRSKNDSAVVNTKQAQGSVPRLRFPGFSGAWTSAPMRSLYEFKPTNSLSRDKLNYECGEVRNIHYGDIHTKYPARFILHNENAPYINDDAMPSRLDPDDCCAVGDMVFADASEDLDDVGKSIEIIDLNGERVLAGMHTILARRLGDNLAVGFGAYLFGSASVRGQIKRESQGAKVFGISPKRLGQTLLLYPDRHKEQQKIADCMASIDADIVAETRKLDVLKARKQGLLQQLFPAEGQRLPRLRFPGFSGRWKVKRMSTLVTRSMRQVTVEPDQAYQEIGIRSHGKGIFHKGRVIGKALGNKRVFWVIENALVLNIVFAWEQAVAVTSTYENGMIASHRFPMYEGIAGSAEVTFLKYLFLTTKGKELLAMASPGGAGRNKTLGQKEFEDLGVLIPDDVHEQKKIAACLSSVDDLIAVQSSRLTALRQHKKGLMQGLFPAMDSHAA